MHDLYKEVHFKQAMSSHNLDYMKNRKNSKRPLHLNFKEHPFELSALLDTKYWNIHDMLGNK